MKHPSLIIRQLEFNFAFKLSKLVLASNCKYGKVMTSLNSNFQNFLHRRNSSTLAWRLGHPSPPDEHPRRRQLQTQRPSIADVSFRIQVSFQTIQSLILEYL